MQPQYNQGYVASGTAAYGGGPNQQASTTVVQGGGGGVGPTQPTAYSRSPFVVESFQAKQSRALGVTLVVVGAMSIVFNIVDLAIAANLYDSLHYYFYYNNYICVSNGCSGHGFWCGTTFIVAGSLGILAGRSRTRCAIIAFMIMAIIANVLAGIQFIIGATGAASAFYRSSDYGCEDGAVYSFCDKFRTLVAMEALLAVMAAMAFVVCLWGSILCCQGSCCSAPLPTYSVPVMQAGFTVVTSQQQQQQLAYPSASVYPVAYMYPPPAASATTPPAGPQYVSPEGAMMATPPPYTSMPPTPQQLDKY